MQINPNATQDLSGEDWWYGHNNSYDKNGIQTGLITCGYARYVNWGFNEQADGGCHNNDFSFDQPIDNEDLETPTRRKGATIQTVALFDLNGNRKWFKTLNTSELFAIKQTRDGGYITIGNTHSTRNVRGGPLYYNPGRNMNTPLQSFDAGAACTFGENQRKMSIVKLDKDGNIVWNYTYGFINYNINDNGRAAYLSDSRGLDIIETATGYRAIGSNTNGAGTAERIYLVDIDKNGIWKSDYELGNPQKNTVGEEIIASTIANEYIISGTEQIKPFNNGGTFDNQQAFVMKINANNIPQWTNLTFGMRTIGVDQTKTEKCTEVELDENGNILLPVIIAFKHGFQGGGTGMIYSIDAATGQNTNNNPNYPIHLGPVQAFDMQFGITKTKDGGFAIITTKQPNGHPGDGITPAPSLFLRTDPTTGEVTHPNPDFLDVWNTDGYIAKFDANGNKLWDMFCPKDNHPPEPIYGDLKKQECLYQITELQNGGLAISGNSSDNFDDSYLVKLGDDCDLAQRTNYFFDDTHYNETNDLLIPLNSTHHWDSRKIAGRIHIKSGGVLIIKAGAVIEFADSRKYARTYLAVEPGGRLIIEQGAILTSLEGCSTSMWDGIQVWGTSAAGQNNWTQGSLIINGGEIHNARTAITNIRHDYVGQVTDGNLSDTQDIIHWDQAGGIIKAENATFLNNRRDVEMMSYSFTNSSSSFKNCNFTTNGRLNYPQDELLPHVSMWDIDGVQFLANTFENKTPQLYAPEKRGSGILAVQSSVEIKGKKLAINGAISQNTPITPNKFLNLRDGVSLLSSAEMITATVDKAYFENNLYGVILDGNAQTVDVTRNTFKIKDIVQVIKATKNSPALTHVFNTTGIYTDGAAGYNIDENNFIRLGTPNTGPLDYTRGINFKLNTSYAGDVYRNNFVNLGSSNQFASSNQNLVTQSLINLNCNNYNSKRFDIAVSSGAIGDQGFTPSFSGQVPIALKANQFSPSCSGSFSKHIYVSPYNATPFNYYSYADRLPNLSCINVPASFIHNEGNLAQGNNVCPTHFSSQGGSGLSGAIIKINIAQLRNKKTQLQTQLNGGNTKGLITFLKNTTPTGGKKATKNTSKKIKTKLLKKAPMLTKEVLFYAAQNTRLKRKAFKKVLLACSPLPNGTLTMLQKNTQMLPPAMLKKVTAAQQGISPVDIIEQQIEAVERQKNAQLHQFIKLQLATDSTAIIKNNEEEEEEEEEENEHSDTKKAWQQIIKILKKEKTTNSQRLMVPILIGVKPNKTQKLINKIKTRAEAIKLFDPAKSNDLKYFANYYQLQKNILSDHRNIFQMTDAETLTLRAIAKQKVAVAANAKAVLQLVYGEVVEKQYETIEPLTGENRHRQMVSFTDSISPKITPTKNLLSSKAWQLTAYPNPTRGQLKIEAYLPPKFTKGQIRVWNVMGQQIATYNVKKGDNRINMNTTHLQKGIYIYTFTGDGTVLSTKRFVKL